MTLRKEHMCAKYSLPPFDWHLVSGESTLHEVTLFEARSRIFLPTAQSCAALFCCRLAIQASSLGWLVGNNKTSSIQAVQVVGTAQRDVSRKKKTKFLSAALQYPNVWNRLIKTSLLCTIKVHERHTPTDLI